MRILFISNELIAGNLAEVLSREGHAVKLYIREKALRECFDGLVEKTENWENELAWVGKNGLIVFDDTGYGKKQDALRKQGYVVLGGSEGGERLEIDRAHAQQVFREAGLRTLKTVSFDNFSSALSFAEHNKRPWVVKCDGHDFKHFIFLGESRDGSDVARILHIYTHLEGRKPSILTLQERVFGSEIGVGRFFNGKAWVGPIEYNIEHPRLYAGNIGPITSEMGTLAWYGEDENETLFRTILAPLAPTLRETGFRGDFSINCIVNKKGIYPLEATTRFGSPIVHLQTALHKSPWGDFLSAVARGTDFSLAYHRGFGVVLLGALPPFPYVNVRSRTGALTKNTPVLLPKHLTPRERAHIHLEGVACHTPKDLHTLHVASEYGYCLYTTGVSPRVAEARQKALTLMKKIRVQKLFYRSDIGRQFEESDRAFLEACGIKTPIP